MIQRISSYLILYKKISFWALFVFYLLFAFLLRAPFFFRDYIDRDESTFILMGQSWVDGHLPYTELWDLKPPLVFAFFATLIYLFGKSFIAIRLAGVFVVAITAFFIEKIGTKTYHQKVGFWAGLLYIIFSSAFGNVQGVMSEHLSMLFFVPGLWCLINFNYSSSIRFSIAGLFFGISLMMKLNLAYAVLFVGLYALYLELKVKKPIKVFNLGILFSIGVLLPAFLTLLPYLLKGYEQIWLDSVIIAPLKYNVYDNGKFLKTILSLVPVIILAALFVKNSAYFKVKHIHKKYLILLFWGFTGILFSFIKIGKFGGHYLIQAYSILSIFVCIALNRFNKFNFKPVIAIFLIAMSVEPIREVVHLVDRAKNGHPIYNEEGIDIPYYLNANHPSEKVFFMDYHIGYWFMDQNPPTKATTHPSNLMRDFLFPYMNASRDSTEEEINYIFNTIQPEIIVIKGDEYSFIKDSEPEFETVQKVMNENYQLIHCIGKGHIYKRKKDVVKVSVDAL